MNKHQVARKYSRSLISSIELQEIPRVIEELRVFSRLMSINRKAKLLFAGLVFTDDEKDRALRALFPRLAFSAHTEKFLRLIIIQGHLASLKEIIIASMNAYNEKKRKATAVVVSPVPLEKGHTERLRTALREMTRKEIDIESQVDASLLGGFIVKVGSTIYDSSVAGQLRLLRAELIK